MGGTGSSLRRGAPVRASSSPPPPADAAAATSPPLPADAEAATSHAPPPILDGGAHLLLEVSLDHRWDGEVGSGFLAEGSVVRNVPTTVRQRASWARGILPWDHNNRGGAVVVRKLQLLRRVQLLPRMEVLSQIGQVRVAAPAEASGLCSFCWNQFRVRKIRVLPCNHAFHSDCVDYYFLRGGEDDDAWVQGLTCPLCDAEVVIW